MRRAESTTRRAGRAPTRLMAKGCEGNQLVMCGEEQFWVLAKWRVIIATMCLYYYRRKKVGYKQV